MTTNCHSDSGELTPMQLFEYIANMTHDTQGFVSMGTLAQVFNTKLCRVVKCISFLRGAGLLEVKYAGVWDERRQRSYSRGGFGLTEYAITSPELQEALQHADKYKELRIWE